MLPHITRRPNYPRNQRYSTSNSTARFSYPNEAQEIGGATLHSKRVALHLNAGDCREDGYRQAEVNDYSEIGYDLVVQYSSNIPRVKFIPKKKMATGAVIGKYSSVG
jgi:hypothetical protein